MFSLSNLIRHRGFSSQGSRLCPLSHSREVLNCICVEQCLLVRGDFIFSIDSLSVQTLHMRVNVITVARRYFLPPLLFLFALCSDGWCNYQSREEAAVVDSLWKTCWDLQTPVGRERNTHHPSIASSSNTPKPIKP